MSKKLDDLEAFHAYGIHVPSRTIKLDQEPDDEEDSLGISAKTASKFFKNIHTLNLISNDLITVVLNSVGGNIDDGYAIFDLIKASASPVTIQVIGQASSMAMVILQAATIRQAYPSSRFLLHDGSISTEGNMRDVEAL